MAQVRVKDADADVIAKVGQAEGDALRAKMEGEAAGLTEKADAMGKLDDATREHEEYRLRLEQELDLQKAGLDAQVHVAKENAQVMAEAFGKANIDIVGGDGQFFDRMVKAISFGKGIDVAIDKSTALQTATKEYLEDGRSLPDDIKDIAASGGISAVA